MSFHSVTDDENMNPCQQKSLNFELKNVFYDFSVNNSTQKTATREYFSSFPPKWAKLGTLFSN
jgi:hypothetical protein